MKDIELRDYFAAKALPALIENYQNEDRLVGDNDNADHLAYLAYLMADSMMKQRKRIENDYRNKKQ